MKLYLSLFLPASFALPLAAQVDFNDQIQPILSEYCYACHGPDSSTRLPEDAPLRIDREDGAFAPRENGKTVIIKGDAKHSLLHRLITSTDKDKLMPPPESHKILPPEKIKLITQWINEGAPYEDHWSFITPIRPDAPKSAGKLVNWPLNSIDNFIASQLAANQLEPNPDSNPARFYRRLHFDLTGLPPTPDESLAFSMDNLDSEIDRLLATDASAEHLARHWLDVARYADTHGIHIDNYRSIWPYRDWVINAYKNNMPFDQFVTEQMAGDLLPNPTVDQLVATGFNRCLPTTGEGGAIAEEYENIYALDQSTTTGTAFLGLTMGCAACHDHKFDPISQKDTYAMNAFFRNTTMSAMDGNNANHPPNVFVMNQEDRARSEEVSKQIASTQAALKAREESAPADYQAWLATIKPNDEVPNPDSAPELEIPLIFSDGKATTISVTLKGEEKQFPANLDTIAGKLNNAPIVNGDPVDLGDLASFSRKEQVSYGGFVRIEGSPTGALIARMNPDENFRGWDLYLQGGKIGGHIIDNWPQQASKIISNVNLSEKTWHHVMVTFDGSQSGPKTMSLYIDGQKAESGITPNTVGENVTTAVPLRLGSRHNNDSRIGGGTASLQNFAFYRRLLSPAEIKSISENKYLNEILTIAPENRSKDDNEVIFRHFLANVDPTHRQLTQELSQLNTELESMKARGSVSLIMEEKKNSKPFANILIRGEYSNKGDKVDANTPEFLFPIPEGSPRNRLGLANWITDKKNPLTARVTMNRLWYYLYGTGLVETTEDFGVMGARPSHPKLLDWLAVEFMESGWDYRHMLKLIVSSKAYRQSEKVDSLKLEADPDNRLISRGPRYRLDAEEIRDMALASSGLMVKEIGGPSVKPYQPDGVWSAVAMKESNTKDYQQGTGADLYRRSLYTIWKRTAAPPSMEILNAPAREISCVRRDLTNTPLQAFVTLNDPQFVEASRRIAENAIKASADLDDRLDYITRRLLTRDLRPDERKLVKKNLQQNQTLIENDPEAPAKIITEGDSEPDPALNPIELATWTITASQILNLDETLTK